METLATTHGCTVRIASMPSAPRTEPQVWAPAAHRNAPLEIVAPLRMDLIVHGIALNGTRSHDPF
jgi:hypothetical protein